MNRKKKLALNTSAGVIKQIVAMVCGFILPKYMLLYFGSSTYGLVSSINHYLGFISLLDMGVGSVILSNLYKPLAQNKDEQISLIYKASNRFFRTLSLIFLAYLLALVVILPSIIDTDKSNWFTISLLLIIAVSTFVEYFFGMTNKLLLDADQRAYIPLCLASCTTILNVIVSILMMRLGAGIHAVKLAAAFVYVLRPFVQSLYVNSHYHINKMVQLEGEPIKQKWNGFSQHLAAVVCQNVDVIALTVFSTMENVAIYSVYYTVVTGIQQIVMTAATGVESLLGNMLANNEREKLSDTFGAIEWFVHTLVTIVFSIAAVMLVPFMIVYTNGITDAEYIQPLFGILLTGAYAAMCLRVPYFRLIKAAGHFKQTQNGAYIAAAINILITFVSVAKFGLIGAAVGTLIALVFHTCYFAFYLRKNIINRSIFIFIRYVGIDLFIAFLTIMATQTIMLKAVSYLSWVIMAIKVGLITLCISAVVNILFNRKHIHDIVNLVRNKVR